MQTIDESKELDRRYYDSRQIEFQREFWSHGSLSEITCQNVPDGVRSDLTNTRQKDDYKSFFLKKTTWDAIRTSRGWKKRGSISRFAEELKITRQYAADLVSCNCGCSSNVMRRIVELLSLRDDCCWCHLFDRSNLRGVDNNHPIFNQAKYMGEIPYEQYSIAALTRERDYEVQRAEK